MLLFLMVFTSKDLSIWLYITLYKLLECKFVCTIHTFFSILKKGFHFFHSGFHCYNFDCIFVSWLRSCLTKITCGKIGLVHWFSVLTEHLFEVLLTNVFIYRKTTMITDRIYYLSDGWLLAVLHYLIHYGRSHSSPNSQTFGRYYWLIILKVLFNLKYSLG